jgi:DNA mismatch endonuclease, patch repair protein
MADIFSKAKRSEIMAAVRSTGALSTEANVVAIFRRQGLTGWRRQPPLVGKPDFSFPHRRVVLFVDGCFWHGCTKHLRMPSTNRAYWDKKIARNQERDRWVTRELRHLGWRVVRLWEHELQDDRVVMRRVTAALRVAVRSTGGAEDQPCNPRRAVAGRRRLRSSSQV